MNKLLPITTYGMDILRKETEKIKDIDTDLILTAEYESFCPLPFFLSGTVTTDTTLQSFRIKMSREGTAKPGVPIKIILISKRLLY